LASARASLRGCEDAGSILDPAAEPSGAPACLIDACPDLAATFREAGRVAAVVLGAER
jgi:hypothetical protein